MSRNDYQLLLKRDGRKTNHWQSINPATLSVFQRILLVTDGTVTDMLEAYLNEQIQIVKLKEQLVTIPQDIPALEIGAGSEVIERHVLLQGKASQKNYIYAQSLLVPERLKDELRQDILSSSIPLGQLWINYKLEMFKQIIDNGKEPANNLSTYFPIAQDDQVLFRTYRVFSNNLPCFVITEKFPVSYFTDPLLGETIAS